MTTRRNGAAVTAEEADATADGGELPADIAKASAKGDDQPKSFEQAAERLGQIVEQLEGDELTLEQAIALFEEGVRVNRQAQARLDEAEKRVEELLAVDPKGHARTRAFETNADVD